MADRRRNPSTNRPPRPAAPLTGAIGVDPETAAALALFNTRLSQQAEGERAQRRIDKATREKDQAAARVRALEKDTKATAEQRADAAAAYKAALEAIERAKNGDASRPDGAGSGETPTGETPTGEAPTDEPATDEGAPPDAEPEVDAVEPLHAALDEAPPGDS
jgi:hypothetical protein